MSQEDTVHFLFIYLFIYFFFFFFEILPWADLSVLYKELVFRSAQHYISFNSILFLYDDGEWYNDLLAHN